MYTYSGAPAVLDTSLTALQVHHLMKSPTLLARELKSLVDEKFIADFLLTGRYRVEGGAIAYPAAMIDIYPKDRAEAVGPLSQYPLTQMDSGQLAIAQTLKEAIATHVADEEISRMKVQPVRDATDFLGNEIVRTVDSIGLAVIASKVTATFASATTWTGATAARGIVTSILGAKAQASALKRGVSIDTVVLNEAQYQQAMAELLLAGILPREGDNPILSGSWPTVLGVTWVTSPNAPFADPLLVDRQKLGGMADENIVSPEFVTAGSNVEIASDRLATRDGYEVRARRVVVPVVTRPWAGVRITGHGL